MEVIKILVPLKSEATLNGINMFHVSSLIFDSRNMVFKSNLTLTEYLFPLFNSVPFLR